MKSIFIIILACFVFNNTSNAQDSIVGYEYFFDVDPGLGNGNFTSFSEVQDIELVAGIDVSTLSEGHHQLFIRTKDSSGVWSLTQEQDFINVQAPASNDIIGFEYFYDTDLGNGSGIYIPHGNTQNLEVVQHISGPSSFDHHTLFVRSLDENGIWSHTKSQVLLKEPQLSLKDIVDLEYYFDTDPGIGNGINAAVTNSHDITLSQNISLALANGNHIINLRTRDENGSWSHTNSYSILKESVSTLVNMKGVEYYFDTDPGIGNGWQIMLPNSSNISDQSFIANVGSLSTGMHKIGVRSYDQNLNYSHANHYTLYKDANSIFEITKLEYFVGDDPGLGNANALSLTSSLDIQDLYRTLSPGSWTNGGNHLSIRSRDQNGVWSLTNTTDIVQIDLDTSRIIRSEYFINNDPGLGNGINISLTKDFDIKNLVTNVAILDQGLNYIGIRSLDSLGKWSLTNHSQFLNEDSPNLKIDSLEYFIDTDPGYGNGTPILASKSAEIMDMSAVIPINGLNQGMHELHVRSRDSLLSYSQDNISSFYLDLSPKNTPLRSGEYFFNADPGLGQATAFSFPESLDTDNLTVMIMGNGLPIGMHDLYIRTCDTLGVWSLTNIKEDIEVNMPLPVSWLSFEVEKIDKEVALTWEIADKINVAYYNVQKLHNGVFETFRKVLDKIELNQYNFLDKNPENGLNSYRIEQVDYDGRSTLSPVRTIFFESVIGVTIGPNPTNSMVNLMGVSTPYNIRVYNENGQLLINENNASNQQINLEMYPEGSYYMAIDVNGKAYKFLIIKI